jgi:hypothetical protein
MNNAAAAQKAFEGQIAYERQVTGKTLAQCQESNALCMNRVGNVPNVVQTQCTPYFQQCMTNATAALASNQPQTDPAPAPAPAPGGGQQTASTCGLPGGTATVVIADPAVTTLNVRDKPAGNILTQIAEGTQVNVVGGCGVQLAAGIVAGSGNAQPPVPGWCAISSPQIGCVSEQFLVAGIPAGGQVTLPPAAGIVATQPQQQAAATFTGRWNAEAQGSPYTFNLTQTGDNVSGAYVGGDGSNGQITGTLTGNILRFQWWQADGVRGMGKFTLSGDGSSFTGSYTLGSNPDVAEGSWNGWRQ